MNLLAVLVTKVVIATGLAGMAEVVRRRVAHPEAAYALWASVLAVLIMPSIFLRHPGDAQRVGRTWRPEGNPGCDNQAVAGRGDAPISGYPAGPVNHICEAGGICTVHATKAPGHGQTAGSDEAGRQDQGRHGGPFPRRTQGGGARRRIGHDCRG